MVLDVGSSTPVVVTGMRRVVSRASAPLQILHAGIGLRLRALLVWTWHMNRTLALTLVVGRRVGKSQDLKEEEEGESEYSTASRATVTATSRGSGSSRSNTVGSFRPSTLSIASSCCSGSRALDRYGGSSGSRYTISGSRSGDTGSSRCRLTSTSVMAVSAGGCCCVPVVPVTGIDSARDGEECCYSCRDRISRGERSRFVDRGRGDCGHCWGS